MCLTDLLPPIAAAGLETPTGVQGTSLMPLLTGQASAGIQGGQAGQTGEGAFARRYVYGELRGRSGSHKAIADGAWKLAVYEDREHLFHLAADPHERHNLIEEAAEQAASLRRALAGWAEGAHPA